MLGAEQPANISEIKEINFDSFGQPYIKVHLNDIRQGPVQALTRKCHLHRRSRRSCRVSVVVLTSEQLDKFNVNKAVKLILEVFFY